jgi:hypothetical protein
MISTPHKFRFLKIDKSRMINKNDYSPFIQDQATLGLFSMRKELSSIVQVFNSGF